MPLAAPVTSATPLLSAVTRPILAQPAAQPGSAGKLAAMSPEEPERGDEPVGQVDALAVPRFAGLRTFARLPSLEEVGRADVAVLGAPFDGAATFRAGARFGPAAIREASLLLRPYNETLGVDAFATVQVADAGDAPATPIGVEEAHGAIERAAAGLVEAGGRVLGLGGDHSVSLPLLRAAAARLTARCRCCSWTRTRTRGTPISAPATPTARSSAARWRRA